MGLLDTPLPRGQKVKATSVPMVQPKFGKKGSFTKLTAPGGGGVVSLASLVTTIQVEAEADAYIGSSTPSSIFADSATWIVGGAGNAGLLRYPLSSIFSLSDVDSITDVKLYLWHSTHASNAAGSMTIHGIKSANAGWTNAAVTGPTWNNKINSPTTAWAGSAGLSTAGTDYVTTPLATFAFGGVPGVAAHEVVALNLTEFKSFLTNENIGQAGIIAKPVSGTWRGNAEEQFTASFKANYLEITYGAPSTYDTLWVKPPTGVNIKVVDTGGLSTSPGFEVTGGELLQLPYSRNGYAFYIPDGGEVNLGFFEEEA